MNSGERSAVRATLRQSFDDIALYPLSATEEYEAMLNQAQAGYGRFLQLLRARAEPEEMIAAFGEFQLLCALREGPYGVSGVNEQLEQMLNRKRAIALPRHRAGKRRWPARLVPDARRQHQVGTAKSSAGARYRLGDDGA